MLLKDPEKQAERLLRRMKRDYRYSLTIGDQSLSAGHRTYLLNDSFVSKEIAKEWIIKKMQQVMNSQQTIQFQRFEKPHMVLRKRMVVTYEADVFDGMDSTHYLILSDGLKWRIWENNSPPILWGKREEYDSAEDAMAFIQTKTNQSIQGYLEAFK